MPESIKCIPFPLHFKVYFFNYTSSDSKKTSHCMHSFFSCGVRVSILLHYFCWGNHGGEKITFSHVSPDFTFEKKTSVMHCPLEQSLKLSSDITKKVYNQKSDFFIFLKWSESFDMIWNVAYQFQHMGRQITGWHFFSKEHTKMFKRWNRWTKVAVSDHDSNLLCFVQNSVPK